VSRAAANPYAPADADAPPGSSPASALAVSDLNAAAKDLIEGAFPRLWVRGEVTGFTRHRNGHWYFSLRDAEAQLPCVVWKSVAQRLPATPDEGMQVVALGQMTVWKNRAKLQFSVTTLEADGEGLWRKALEETRRRLDADGLLDPARKRPLPRLPRTVAVITSPDGAALHDVVTVAHRRHPGVRLVVAGAQVQGEGAVPSLLAALERVVRWGGADVVIIGRGGGSREDLWAFNDEALARAIAACPVPVVSAVGHETDVSISDLVADLRAPTPSAAAEAVVPDRADLARQLEALSRRLVGASHRRQLRAASRFGDVRRRFVASGRHRQLRMAARLERVQARLLAQARERQLRAAARLGTVRARLAALAERTLAAEAHRLAAVGQRLAASSRRHVAGREATVRTLAGRLEALSPLAVLARGYAVARDDRGASLSRVEQFPPRTPLRPLGARRHRRGRRHRKPASPRPGPAGDRRPHRRARRRRRFARHRMSFA
jgi:exodeoxyribonuclease VII large subunit